MSDSVDKDLSTSENFTYIPNRGQSSIRNLQRRRNWNIFNCIGVYHLQYLFGREFDIDFDSWAIHLEALLRLQGHISRANDENSILLTISPSLTISVFMQSLAARSRSLSKRKAITPSESEIGS